MAPPFATVSTTVPFWYPPAVTASKDLVKVMMENGRITLSGEVEWNYQRRNATNTVRHLSGVKGASDVVRIKTQSHSHQNKLDIEAALERRYDAEDQDISVAVQDVMSR
jgi:osmotically-inducible protein OsmY